MQRHISAWGEGKKREKLRSKRLVFFLIFCGRETPCFSSDTDFPWARDVGLSSFVVVRNVRPVQSNLSTSHGAGSTSHGVATPLPREAARLLATVQAVVREAQREAGVVQL